MPAVTMVEAAMPNAAAPHAAQRGTTVLQAINDRRALFALAVALAAVPALLLLPETLSRNGRITLVILALAIIGWTLTRMGDVTIALLAAVALVVAGAATPSQLYATLGNDLIWLLFSAFVIAAVLRASGVAEQVALAVVRRCKNVATLFHGVTFVIITTALVFPSTSGRAALLLPVFLALAGVLGEPRLTRALSLVFPTTVLLSAGGSLIGAGAHLVAVDFIAKTGHGTLDYLDWLMIGMPLSVVSCHAATEMILRLFLAPHERWRPLELAPRTPLRLARVHICQLGIIAITVLLWVTARRHGVEIAVIAVGAAVAMTLPGVSDLGMKAAAKSVEWELLLFVAATLLMGHALLGTDADEWLASGLLGAIGRGATAWFVSALVAIIALLGHLVITSRTARVTVLIPAVALPVAGLGYDPVALILLTVFGTGFCQTMTASAKAVAIYSLLDVRTFSPRDLFSFSARFLPVIFALMMASWFLLWPVLGIGSTSRTPVVDTSPVPGTPF